MWYRLSFSCHRCEVPQRPRSHDILCDSLGCQWPRANRIAKDIMTCCLCFQQRNHRRVLGSGHLRDGIDMDDVAQLQTAQAAGGTMGQPSKQRSCPVIRRGGHRGGRWGIGTAKKRIRFSRCRGGGDREDECGVEPEEQSESFTVGIGGKFNQHVATGFFIDPNPVQCCPTSDIRFLLSIGPINAILTSLRGWQE